MSRDMHRLFLSPISSSFHLSSFIRLTFSLSPSLISSFSFSRVLSQSISRHFCLSCHFLNFFFSFLSFLFSSPFFSPALHFLFFVPSSSSPQLLSVCLSFTFFFFLSLFFSLSLSLFMGSIRTGSLTVQDGMKRFGMSWSGAGSNSWTNEPTDRTAGACSQIDARGSSWAPLFVYLLHPLYSLLTLLILVHSMLQARKG